MTKSAPHPLDQLSAAEITQAAALATKYATSISKPNLRFNTITLAEPTKAQLIAFNKSGTTPPRCAFCILQFPPSLDIVETTIDLVNGKVLEWTDVPNAQPVATPDDCFEAEEIAKQDATVKKLLADRGITNTNLVACDPWSVHLAPCPGRLIQTFMYHRSHTDDNHYCKPIDFVPVVDLHLKKVVHIDMPYGDKTPEVPSSDHNYHRNLQTKPWRTDLKPLDVVQPEGPSFSVDGNLVRWQNWSIRVGFNYREGLVLHDVRYQDAGKERPIMWRASLVEMAVPYADTAAPYVRKCAFDVGDYGLGNCTNSLELGCDCLGHIHYFDAMLNDTKGKPVTLKNAVCLHEEDHGILWKHLEYRNNHAEVRRSRRLVLSFVCTVVNYEYAFYYYFYQDGTIGFEIKLTGELSTNMLSPGENPEAPRFGVMVAPGVNSQLHQHMFAARLDMSVDDEEGGRGLEVVEVNFASLPEGPENPCGNGFVAQETALLREREAQRTNNPSTGRFWKVKNPSVINPTTGTPVAYKLVTSAAPLLLAQPSSLVAKKGVFATKNLWVTPHQDNEMWPAGDYPMGCTGGKGLPAWTAKDRDVGPGNDPVLWPCFGVTDFPVMPVEMVGFHLKPVNFFDGNPGIDIPPGKNAASKCCAANGHANGVNGH